MLEHVGSKSEKTADPREDMVPLRARMTELQQWARTLGLPAVIVFEGFDASGKGELISHLIESLDPRAFKVHTVGAPNEVERRYPPMRRFQVLAPAQGRIEIFDRSWYRDVSIARFEQKLSKSQLATKYHQIADFEGKLATSGALILKFFLCIGKKEQKKRFDKLESEKATRWRVTKKDWAQHKRFDETRQVYDEMLEQTDFSFARWHVIDSTNIPAAAREVYHIAIDAFAGALARRQRQLDAKAESVYGFVPYVEPVPTEPIPLLGQVDLSARLPDDAVYKDELKQAHRRLRELHSILYKKKIPVVLGFEGWDAAGKGGNILRLSQALDPRGYEVCPTSAPDATERARHYLWRFWSRVPKDGHIAIFDRTWYGRVMVERVEGFCAGGDWSRAYDEINQFEKELADWGAIVLKFWLQIDQDEQLKRFNDRKNDPDKQYKTTDEDWRNREKWPLYETAVNDMLQKTNTAFAPWIIVEANDKHYARLKVLHAVIAAIEARLG